MKKSIGVIAEYNPFHNGHLLHLTEARCLAGGDLPVIAVMSGSVVQRGEPAFCKTAQTLYWNCLLYFRAAARNFLPQAQCSF